MRCPTCGFTMTLVDKGRKLYHCDLCCKKRVPGYDHQCDYYKSVDFDTNYKVGRAIAFINNDTGKMKKWFVRGSLEIILLCLLDKSKCGYDLMSDIKNIFDTKMSHGNIYPELYTLERGGFLTRTYSGTSVFYQINDKGKALLEERFKLYEKLVDGLQKLMSNCSKGG